MIYSTITCIIITILIVIFGTEILSLFTNDPNVIAVGEEYLVIASSFYVIFSAMFIINGMLRGAGAVMVPMISTLVALWVVRIPAAMWFSSMIGVTGIWWSIPFGWCFGCVFAYIYYRTGKWKNKYVFAQKK